MNETVFLFFVQNMPTHIPAILPEQKKTVMSPTGHQMLTANQSVSVLS